MYEAKNTSKSKKSSIASLSNVELSKFRIDGDHVFFDDTSTSKTTKGKAENAFRT